MGRLGGIAVKGKPGVVSAAAGTTTTMCAPGP